MKPEVSVAMTTYNGAAFVEQQLDSLRLQTIPIDEVVIRDDCSSDGTFEIMQEYIIKWNLGNWTVIRNEHNLGWKQNFYSCIERCRGEIVFFCDQDDIWYKEKIEYMIGMLNQYEEAQVLACKLTPINADGQTIHDKRVPFQSSKTKKVAVNPVNEKFAYSIHPGCTLAVKRSIINLLTPYMATTSLPHDALFWKMATLFETAFVVDQPLIFYRIHSNNASNPAATLRTSIKSSTTRIQEVSNFEINLLEVQRLYELLCKKEIIENVHSEQLKRQIQFCDERRQFLQGKENLMAYLKQYRKYYLSMKMMVGDILSRNR